MDNYLYINLIKYKHCSSVKQMIKFKSYPIRLQLPDSSQAT